MKATKTQNNSAGRFRRRLLTVAAAFLMFSSFAGAQVTVGAGDPPQDFSILEVVSNGTGGLRLPRLTNDQRKTLTESDAFKTEIIGKGKGLTIYNISINCVEYWNGTKWISLCSGNASFEGGDCAENPIPSAGGSTSCAITDPNCDIDGEYTFTFVTGADYAAINVTNAGAGAFTLTFEANDRASDRQAIVMVTSPCGASSMLVFTQTGNTSGCGTTTVPAIKSVGGTAMCGSGAAYLYLEGYPDGSTDVFIWTLNGQQVGTGYSYTATVPGKYIVYGDKIGCTNKQEFQLTLDGTGAPDPVQLIVVGNNGQACGVGGSVKLIASAPSSGTVIWFCDGKLTNKTGTEIDATKGYWEAVVQDGTCYSTPSAGVTVTENTSGGSITPPTIKINGQTSGWTFCRGGSLFLEVDGTMEDGVTYTWYADNTQIGTGTGIYYPVPSVEQVVIRLRATGTGCAQEAYTLQQISTQQAPGAPFISCNTPGNALCGGEATLSATGGDSYRWFRDGVEIAGQTASSLKVTQTGSYTASAVSSGGCVSVQSGATVITASDFATLSWVSHPIAANIGETKTYSVSLDFPQGATYSWTVTGGTITNGQGTSSVTVNFSAAGSATISCEASNACGNAIGSPISETVTIGTACSDAVITSNSTLTPSIKIGNRTTLNITATGTNITYQWYEGTIGAGTAIGGATSAGYEYTGTTAGDYNFYCIATPTGGCAAATSKQFTVTVKTDPSLIPTGTGTLVGKNCFDIAQGNDNTNSCAPLSARTGQRTDFSLRTEQDQAAGTSKAVYSGVQIYTFTPSGAVSNVRFDYVDASGKVIESLTPNGTYTGNISSGTPCKVTVNYKASLNTDLKGLTRANVLKADIYAVYNDAANGGGTDKAVKLTATLSDCACCGAATVDGGWLTFMCHNLGANESLDPFTWKSDGNRVDNDIKGYLYQWGRKADGHQSRSSAKASGPANAANLDEDGQIAETSSYYGKFIYTTANHGDWRSTRKNDLWGDGTDNSNPAKADNDPCPAGWKVPSSAQWVSIFNGTTTNGQNPSAATANKWTWTGNGYMVGDALFLPAAGYRGYSDGTVRYVGSDGYYWSSTLTGTNNAYTLNFDSSAVTPTYNLSLRGSGRSVRCVPE